MQSFSSPRRPFRELVIPQLQLRRRCNFPSHQSLPMRPTLRRYQRAPWCGQSHGGRRSTCVVRRGEALAGRDPPSGAAKNVGLKRPHILSRPSRLFCTRRRLAIMPARRAAHLLCFLEQWVRNGGLPPPLHHSSGYPSPRTIDARIPSRSA